MKLYFLKDEALEELRYNVKSNLDNYKLTSNAWIYEMFPENPFEEFSKEVPEFVLDTSIDDVSMSDVTNAKILYTAMKEISLTQASDERLWAGLAHGQLWEYMYKRWDQGNKMYNEDSIKGHYFYHFGSARSTIMHTISRLWWIAKLTYDENRDNPFELLDFFNNDFNSKVLILSSSSYANNFKLMSSILEVLIEYERLGKKANRKLYSSLSRYLNILGGNSIIDFLDKEDIKSKLWNKINNDLA